MSVFDLNRIADECFVNQIDFHQRLGSTNDQAIDLLKHHRPALPLLVLAENQFAGRGQGSASWIAESGSLTFSLCIPNSGKIPTLLPLAAGLAVAETIERIKSGDDQPSLLERSGSSLVQLKWPNDVLIDGKKAAGILTEHVQNARTTVSSEQANPAEFQDETCYVIGIGINVNNDMQPIKTSVRLPKNQSAQKSRQESAEANEAAFTQQFAPTSMQLATGSKIEISDFLIHLLNELESILKRLADTPASIITACQSKLIFLNRRIKVQRRGDHSPNGSSDASSLIGKCVGLGNQGELLVEADGSIQNVFSGQVLKYE